MKLTEFKTEKGEFVVMELTTREERGIECNPMLKLICKLSEATEGDLYVNGFRGENLVDSLHSLLTSKGIDINNGNWYLFKKV